MDKKLTAEINNVPNTKNAVVLKISGELDSHCIKKLNECFDTIRKSNRNFIITEMSDVTVISSASLGELIGVRKQLIENGGDLVCCGLSIEIRTKLNLIGASRVFRFYSDIRSALNAYRWEIEQNPEKVELTLPPFLKLVPPVRQLMNRIAHQKGYGIRDSFRIETITDEICNNAVEHGTQDVQKKINLSIKIDPQKVEIDVCNANDPDQIESLNTFLTQTKEGRESMVEEKRGRGLALIKLLSDELSIDCSETGTCVHVKKARRE